MRCGVEQKAFNVYATATLSGDVANAIALLKRMARPTSRKHKVRHGVKLSTHACKHQRVHSCTLACTSCLLEGLW